MCFCKFYDDFVSKTSQYSIKSMTKAMVINREALLHIAAVQKTIRFWTPSVAAVQKTIRFWTPSVAAVQKTIRFWTAAIEDRYLGERTHILHFLIPSHSLFCLKIWSVRYFFVFLRREMFAEAPSGVVRGFMV